MGIAASTSLQVSTFVEKPKVFAEPFEDAHTEMAKKKKMLT